MKYLVILKLFIACILTNSSNSLCEIIVSSHVLTENELDCIKNKPEQIHKLINIYQTRLRQERDKKRSSKAAIIQFNISKLYYLLENTNYFDSASCSEIPQKEHKSLFDNNSKYSNTLKNLKITIMKYPETKVAIRAREWIGRLYYSLDELDSASIYLRLYIDNHPQDKNFNRALFVFGELEFRRNSIPSALNIYEKVIRYEKNNFAFNGVPLYRIGECHYHLKSLEKAIQYFFLYIKAYDNNNFSKYGMRSEALEYLAISFGDLQHGSNYAISFFNRNGNPAFKDSVLSAIVRKNVEFGNCEKAADNLHATLNLFPDFPEADLLQVGIRDCHKRDTTISGSRSKSSIMPTIFKGVLQLKNTYRNYPNKKDSSGKISVRILINESGKVIHTDIYESSIKDDVFKNMVLDLILQWKFDKINKISDTTEVIYPFMFMK